MNMATSPVRVLITGGAGYIGSALTRRLLRSKDQVRTFDAHYFGNGVAMLSSPLLENVRGDIRDADQFRDALAGIDVVVHLAAVANDPSFDLDPGLGKSVNFDSLEHVMRLSREAGVRRFIYASSASVYGISDDPEVGEDHPLVPITDYNRYKALGEEVLFGLTEPGFETVALRAATVCGVSARQRLDLTVNLLTAQAVEARKITVFGGAQYRPNIHIDDLAAVYQRLVRQRSLGSLSGQSLNAGGDNMVVADIARLVAERVGARLGTTIEITTTPTDDRRSYRLTSRRLADVLGMVPQLTVGDAVDHVAAAIADGRIRDPLTDSRYYNVRWMKEHAIAPAGARGPRWESA